MKLMLKKLCMLALCASMLAGAVACGGQEGGDIDTANTNAEATESDATTDDAATEGTTTDGTTTEDTTTDDTTVEPKPEDFVITEADGVAQVVTPDGLKYSVTGYLERAEKAFFAFDKTLKYTFPEGAFSKAFNRFSVSYKSTEPVKITVAYRVSKFDTTDAYFLEAGEGVFSGLPSSFMNEAECFDIQSIQVESLTGKAAEFSIKNLTTESIAVPSKSLYIENDRFRLGIDLGWGGTINYIRDKNNEIKNLTNLVNKHDTGRLIQQSFYGTGPIPGVYEPGISFDNQWVYNPVQGGDQYNNSSRLIDLVVTENSVYIKSQPQDWSLDNQLTPSYMENTYTLKDDRIQVDNRFMDFSGWTHPYTGQELPALYTVSYLDTFVWYDGDASWTGDALSSRGDLNFWGDVQYVADCTFILKEKNSETWCAWVNTKDNYGLGLYVPNVDQFKAGRYEYNGSKSSKDGATNYVAPVNIMKLVAFEPLEYSYLLTAGSIEEIRATFTTYKDFTTNASLHKNYTSTRLPSLDGDPTNIVFDGQSKINVLTNLVSTTVEYDESQQAAKLTAGPEGDSNVTVNYGDYISITAETHKILKIEYMIPTDNAMGYYACDIFLCAGVNTNPTGEARLRENLIADGEYHVLEIDLSATSFWEGDVHKIRFDYFDFATAGDVMYVKRIALE